ncbi:uncharacterized protein KGF55_004553 [Candida pseudojiufengensis]|uniref:uncharacterized protein n=1 Tax=Candida pseudojiufengensis TaxID=497109 RepID=UPI00222502B2|nr:uncharacterized protein KGF55_004553 [Candida pseudojiufengensis]KAI5960660.1 hypothetical protein KGF55_004553 [Candida pseudojiufengensis]
MIFISFLYCLSLVLANLANFDDDRHSQVCAGVYSKKDWGGSLKPHIGLNLKEFKDYKYNSKNKEENNNHDDISVSYIIFEYKDLINIGVDLGDGKYKFICDDYAINTLKICSEDQKDNFIVNSNSTNSTILASQLNHLGPADIHYPINRTGYYCVSTFSKYDNDPSYKGIINFQNAFGQLNASEIPKLPAYGILTLCYAIALALFGFQFFKKRKENQILPLQRYLLAMLGFLTFDTLVVWSYYDYLNRQGNGGFAIAYMVFMAICNAIKITFSFFLLLCIALGYGVVKLKLKKRTMLYCKLLAGFNFVSALVYLIFNYLGGSSSALVSSDSIDEGTAGSFLLLLPLIPISISLSIYYITILSSIRKTTQALHQQRQIIKLQLYQNLFRIIFLAIVITFLGLTLSSFIYLSMSTTEMFEQHWKSAFFIFDFWPSVVFFVVFLIVAWLWRPTETSYMLAVSQQLSTNADDEDPDYQQPGGHEFELDDLSLMSHDDEENNNGDDETFVNSSHRNVARDSFEIAEDDEIKKKKQQNQPAPPTYEEVDHNNTPSENGENGGTLFDLGEEDDSDVGEDDRLKNERDRD